MEKSIGQMEEIIMEVVMNKRSGVIHTRDCQNVKQIHKENLKIIEDADQIDYESKLNVCQHCLDIRQRRYIRYRLYEEKRKKLLQEKKEKLAKTTMEYRKKSRKIATQRDTILNDISERYNTKIKKLDQKNNEIITEYRGDII